MKKYIALLLAALMLLSALAGCTSGKTSETQMPAEEQTTQVKEEETKPQEPAKEDTPVDDGSLRYQDGVVMSPAGEFPIVKEGDVTLTIGMYTTAIITDYEDNAFTKYIEDRTGVKIKFDFLGTNASEALTQIQLRMATGEKLPDVLMDVPFSYADYSLYGQDGVLIPLQDYLEKYGFYYQKALETMKDEETPIYEALQAMRLSYDGNMYAFPKYGLGLSSTYDKQWYINKVWLDELGLDIPTTTDELYDVLVAFRDQDPNGNGEADEIPMLGASGSGGYVANVEHVILPAFVYFSPYTVFVSDDDGKLSIVGSTDEFREGCKYINKLVTEGLIPDFSFTQANAQQKAIVDPPAEEPSLVGVVVENPNFAFNSDSERVLDYVALPPLTGPDGTCYASYYDTALKFTTFITSSCEYPEIAVRFIDAFYDMETYLHLRWGEEDVDWWYAEDDDFCRYTDMGYKTFIRTATGLNLMSQENNKIWGSLPVYYCPQSKAATVDVAAAKTGLDLTTPAGWRAHIHDQGMFMRWGKETENWVPGTNNLLLTKEEQAVVNQYSSLYVFFAESRTRFFTGELDPNSDADWNAYIDEMKARGGDVFLQMYQQAYDRYLANK